MSRFQRFLHTILIALVAPISLFSYAHNMGHSHHEPKVSGASEERSKPAQNLNRINEAYKQDVKPIFIISCFDCHSQSPNLPWYHSLPLVRGLLEWDMREAKVHLDFTKDFPFEGHGSPSEDLEAIAESVNNGSMPPFRYRFMHQNSGLSKEEKKVILKWISESEQLLLPSP